MDLRGEPTTVTLPSLRNSQRRFKYFSLHPRVSTVFIPHQEKPSLQQMESIIDSHNQANCRVVESSPKRYICNPTPTSEAQASLETSHKCLSVEGTESWYENVSPRNVRSHNHKVLLTCLPQGDSNKSGTSKHAYSENGRLTRPQPWTKAKGQLRNVEIWRNNPPQRRAHQLGMIMPVTYTYK